MNKNHKNYIKKERKGQIIFIVLILLAVAIGLLWNELEAQNKVPEWPGQVKTYPMANAHISWLQTYYGGAWNE